MQACELADLIRIHDEAGALMIALANGHEDGWSTCWARGSRLVLDLLLEAWRAARGELAERAPAAIDEVRRQFPARARALAADDPDDLCGAPAGTIVMASIDGASGRFDWIGPDSGLVIRGGAVATQTLPHTLQERAREEGVLEENVAKLPPVAVRFISAHVAADFDSSGDERSFLLEPGDCVLLVNDDLRSVLSAADLVACASAHDAPQTIAADLVARAFESGSIPYAAAVAVRCDEVSAT